VPVRDSKGHFKVEARARGLNQGATGSFVRLAYGHTFAKCRACHAVRLWYPRGFFLRLLAPLKPAFHNRQARISIRAELTSFKVFAENQSTQASELEIPKSQKNYHQVSVEN
jgi:hypothetical protein